MPYQLRCTFRPQIWGFKDSLYEAEPLGPTQWATYADSLPEENSIESDHLRYAKEAPQWCQEWSGPFEVDYEVI
jgi:hypothetical protein